MVSDSIFSLRIVNARRYNHVTIRVWNGILFPQ